MYIHVNENILQNLVTFSVQYIYWENNIKIESLLHKVSSDMIV
jgi:hypothetical protein